MPALTLGISGAMSLMRLTRTSVLEVLRLNYVRTARAKGVAEKQVLSRHVLRNALIPVVTSMGLRFGHVVGGTVVVETLFARPGLERYMMAFPSFILPIAITGILRPSVSNIVLAMALTSWGGYARMMRSSVLSIMQIDLVEAAKTMGGSRTILAISGLSFIGLGAQAPMPEWGTMLKHAMTFIAASPHLCSFPGLMIMLTVLGFNLLGDGLRAPNIHFETRYGNVNVVNQISLAIHRG